METLFINQDTYQLLRWLKPFISTDHARPNITLIHIIDEKLYVTDGFSLAVVDIPSNDTEFTKFCKEVRGFEIVALVARPRLAILKEIFIDSDNSDMRPFRNHLVGYVESCRPDKKYLKTSIGHGLLERFHNLPTGTGFTGTPCRFYIKDKNSPVVIAVPGADIILMPMHSGE